MKIFLPILLFGIMSFPSFAAKDKQDFSLQVHIVKVDMAQGRGALGIVVSPNLIVGGGSYLYRVYTVHIDGSDIEYKMTTRGEVLHIGVYKGHWKKNDDSLEVQFLNDKGKLKHQSFSVTAEAPLPSEQTSAGKQPNQ